MNISQEKAACALFYEQYNEERGKQLLEKIRELGPFKICYDIKDDFRQPFLLHENTINGSLYKRYKLYEYKLSDIEQFGTFEGQLNKESYTSKEDSISSKPKEDNVKLLLCMLSAVLLFLVVGLVTNEFPIVHCKLNHFSTKKQ